MHHLKSVSSDFKKHPDSTLAALSLLVKQIIVASQEKKINWNLIEGIFSLVKYALQSVLEEIKVSKKVIFIDFIDIDIFSFLSKITVVCFLLLYVKGI